VVKPIVLKSKFATPEDVAKVHGVGKVRLKKLLALADSSKHKQVTITIKGQTIEVDEHLAEMIQVINTLPGITTHFSCQGDAVPNHRLDAYISFVGAWGKAFLTHFLSLAVIPPICDIAIEISQPDKYVIRWDAFEYPTVFPILRETIDAIRLSHLGKIVGE